MSTIEELVANNEISVPWVSTNDMLADIFTKGLPAPRFIELRDKLGITGSSEFTGTNKEAIGINVCSQNSNDWLK